MIACIEMVLLVASARPAVLVVLVSVVVVAGHCDEEG